MEAAAVLFAHDAVLTSSTRGLVALSLRAGEVEGRLVHGARARRIQVVDPRAVVLGGGEFLKRLQVEGRGPDLRLVETARAPQGGVFSDLAWAPRPAMLWSLSRDRLVAYSPRELDPVGAVALPGEARALAVSGSRGAVAAGRRGLYLLDLSDPERPRLAGRLGGVGFAHDVVLVGSRAYVATGSRGLLVVDVADPALPRVEGVVRDLGFVSAVAVGARGLYALDREGRRLFVLEKKP